jgi:hypothetical protein
MNKIWLFLLLPLFMNDTSIKPYKYKGNECIAYDVMGKPIFKIKSYYFFEGKRIPINDGISYESGEEELSAHLNGMYLTLTKSVVKEQEKWDAKVFFQLFFDEKLTIKDIRILKRENYDNSSFNYDALFKQILLSTQGKWKRTRPDKGVWYYYRGCFSFAKKQS